MSPFACATVYVDARGLLGGDLLSSDPGDALRELLAKSGLTLVAAGQQADLQLVVTVRIEREALVASATLAGASGVPAQQAQQRYDLLGVGHPRGGGGERWRLSGRDFVETQIGPALAAFLSEHAFGARVVAGPPGVQLRIGDGAPAVAPAGGVVLRGLTRGAVTRVVAELAGYTSAALDVAAADSEDPVVVNLASLGPPPPPSRVTVLLLTANPASTARLRVDEEIRAIRAAIERGRYRDDLAFEPYTAVDLDDVFQALDWHKPAIVHFSGHGTADGALVFQDPQGKPAPIAAEALGQLFGTMRDHTRLVVLSACYTETEAEAVRAVIDCTVGTSRAIGDEAAIAFATELYGAIASGLDVATAFAQGNVAALVKSLDPTAPMVLLERLGGVPAKDLVLVGPTPPAPNG